MRGRAIAIFFGKTNRYPGGGKQKGNSLDFAELPARVILEMALWMATTCQDIAVFHEKYPKHTTASKN